MGKSHTRYTSTIWPCGRAIFSHIFVVFAGVFLIRTTYGRASSNFYYHRTASTAQYSTAQSTRASSKTSTCRSERDNAGKETELARASMSSSIYTARCVFKTNKEIQICSASNNIQPTKQLRWCDARRVFACSPLCRSVLFVYTYGVRGGTMELLAFARR